MNTTKTKKAPARPAVRASASKRPSGVSKRQRRSTYPIHKRLMLHPLSVFIFLCAGVYMAGWTYQAIAATTISSTIEAPALSSAATIDNPPDGTVYTSPRITVTGACPSQSYIKLAINGTFSGVAWCNGNGTYSIQTELYEGANRLSVQDYNTTDLPGPVSLPVSVTYTAPASSGNGSQTAASGDSNTQSPGNTGDTVSTDAGGTDPGDKPLVLHSDFTFQSFTNQQPFEWHMNIVGGTAPYMVKVDWNDGLTSKLQLADMPSFTLRHQFKKPGYYAIIVNSTDSKGKQNLFQLAAFITDNKGKATFLGNTTPSTGTPAGTGGLSPNTVKWLLLAWPSYIVVSLMSFSFWLGERRQYVLVAVNPRRKPHTVRRRH